MSVPAVIPSPIAIAGFKDVYQVLRVEDALTDLQELGASASEALRATYVKTVSYTHLTLPTNREV